MRRLQLSIVLIAAALASAPGGAGAASLSTHQLTVKVVGTGSGMIRGDSIDCAAYSGGPVGPCTVTEVSGNHVTLRARASRGSTFVGWSGGGCSGPGSCTVTLNRNVTVTARFTMAVVSVLGRPLTISSSRRTSLLLMHCRGRGTCVGTVTFSTVVRHRTVKLASARYNIAQGDSRELVLRFSRRAIGLIAGHHRKLTVQMTVLPNDGEPLFSSRTLKLA